MSFIDLNKNNITKNKIKGVVETYYNKKDSRTFIYDDFLDSKSLLFNKTNYADSLQDIDLGLYKKDDEEYNKGIKKLKLLCRLLSEKDENILSNNITVLNRIKLEISQRLNIEVSEINEIIKNYNFKNEFHIEKNDARFILGDNYFQKKNIINREIYNNFYSNEEDNFIRNKNYGFCNYNTLNFISVDRDKHSHSNCIIYPNNLIESNTNEYDFINKDIFYFQTRLINRNLDLLESPKCIVHIPGLLNVYIALNSNEQKYRLCITTNEKTKNNINEIITSYNISLNSNFDIERDSLYISESFFEENNWYTLGLILNKNSNKLKLFIDGSFIKEVSIDITNEVSNINSYICIGNKPNYFNSTKNDFIESYNKNFNFYFNRECFLEKNIKVNNSGQIDTNFIETLEDIINNGDCGLFDAVTSEGFLGELSDIRFYSYEPSLKEIEYFHQNYVADLNEQSLLSFYVPVFYIPDNISKKGLLTAEGFEENISYYTYYNPYFASYGGGFELSLENYCVEFLKFTKPNIVINGKIFENIIYEKTAEGLNYLLASNQEEAETRFGIGERVNKIYYDLYNRKYIENFDPRDDSNLDVYASNLLIKNHFVLPNDNGIPNIYFNIIEEFCTKNNIDIKNTFKSFGTNIYSHLNCKDIILNTDFFIEENIDYNTINGYNYNFNYLKFTLIKNSENIDYLFTNDPFLDMSNIIYYSDNINNSAQFFNYLNSSITYNNEKSLAIPKFRKIRDTFLGSDCNPFCRNLFNSTNRMLSGDVFYTKSGFNVSIKYSQYENMIGNFFKDYDNYFSSIIDIPVNYFNSKIQKKSFRINDKKISNISSNLNITLKDDGYGILYRSDCLTKQADWNYVGNIIYSKGLCIINNICLNDILDNELECNFSSESSVHVQEINIPLDYDEINFSQNNSYDSALRKNELAVNSEDSFVYITDVFLHDENFNIISKSKIVRPIPKSDDDRFLIRLKMDY